MDNLSDKKAIKKHFEEIYESYKSPIYKFCLARLNGDSSDAEDCMQNTFMVFYKKLNSNEEIVNPRAYLYKIANNFVLKAIEQKAKNNNTLVPIDDYADKVVEDNERLDNQLDYELLNQRIDSLLTTDEKQLFKFKYIYDMKLEQVAEQMGISKSAAAKRLQRLREKIKSSIPLEQKGDC